MSDWHPLLHDAVRTHGELNVYAAGLHALGYPPTWIHRQSECNTVLAALNNTQHHIGG